MTNKQKPAAKGQNQQPKQPESKKISTAEEDVPTDPPTELWTRADKISRTGLIVNTLMTLFTLGIFVASVLTFVATKDIITDTQKQFEVDNQPYLELSDLKLSTIQFGKSIEFDYKLNNLGKYPVKVITIRQTFGMQTTDPTYEEFLQLAKNSPDAANKYIPNGAPTSFYFISDGVVDSFVYKHLIGEYKIYYYGVCRYINLINQKIKEYRFIAQPLKTLGGGINYRFVYNENVEIKDSTSDSVVK